MATVVGQASAAATSVAIPAHAVGDLIIVSARGTAAAPSVPAAGGTVPAWATLQSALANAIGLTVVAFVATATTTTTGVFTNATHVAVLVLRPAASKKLQTSAARSAVGNGNNTQTIIYPALVLIRTDGTSFGVRVGTRTVAITAVGTPPTGWTNQSIQPAGAAALMSVHSRAALVANPAADTVTVTSSNAAYRAVTVEVEELAVTTDFAVAIAGAAAVAPQRDSVKSLAVSVAGVGAVTAAATIPTSLAIAIAGNQPYAGEHTAGEFLAGMEPVLIVDLAIVSIDLLDGLIAGQASITTSLSVTRSPTIAVAGAASLSAQQAVVRSLAASLAGAGAVVAQENQVKGLAVPVAGAGALTAQADRTRAVAATVAGAGAVSADTTVTPPSGGIVSFATSVAGSGAVAAALGASRSLSTSISGASAIVVGQGVVLPLASAITGASALSAQTVETRALAVAAAGAGAVSPSLTISIPSVVNLDVAVGGQAAVAVQVNKVVQFAAAVTGAGAVAAQVSPTRRFASSIAGQAALSVQQDRTRSFASSITGVAAVTPTLAPFRIVSLACTIEPVEAICGLLLCGTFLVGEKAGPHATVRANMTQTSLGVAVGGQANITANMAQTSLGVAVGGQANVEVGLNHTRALATAIVGKADVTAVFGLRFFLDIQIGGQAKVAAKLVIPKLWELPCGDFDPPAAPESSYGPTPAPESSPVFTAGPESSLSLVGAPVGDIDLDPLECE